MRLRGLSPVLFAACTAWGEPAEKVQAPADEPAAPSAKPRRRPPALEGCNRIGGGIERWDPQRDTAATELAIAESAIRELFARNASGIQRAANRVCVDLFDEDAPAQLLDALRGLRARVMPGSKFRERRNDLRLRVDRIWLDDETHAEVGGGYYEASLSASGDHLWLELRDGEWLVVDRSRCWIS